LRRNLGFSGEQLTDESGMTSFRRFC
jgi:hypothetical protein